MQTTNRDLMQQARDALKGRWGLAVGGNVIYIILGMLIQAIPRVGWIGGLIVGGPLLLGWTAFFLSLSRKQEAQLSQLFEGFQNFTRALVAYLLLILFVLLWTILLVVPGIMAALSYSQTFFILAENPQMESLDALRKSKTMMHGKPLEAFLPLLEIFWMVPTGNPNTGDWFPMDHALYANVSGPVL